MNYNEEKTYAIVDSKNKVIEYFRTKATAIYMFHKFQKNYDNKLRIVKLK